jgi:hypothetical protein
MKIFLVFLVATGFLPGFWPNGIARAGDESMSLAGKWRFSRDEGKAGITAKWYGMELKTEGGGPNEISLPGTTDEAKAGIANPKKPSLQGLYRPNVYTGPAWYQREIDIPPTWKGKDVTLFLERNHWVTRVWLDDRDVGTRDSLISPQVFDLGTTVTPGPHRLTVCEDNTLIHNLGEFVSINYEGTQTNWNGIIGRIELRATDPVALSDVEVYPDVDRKLIQVVTTIANVTNAEASGTLRLSVTDAAGVTTGSPVSTPFLASNATAVVTIAVPMGEHPKLWDEYSPNLYRLKVAMAVSNPACSSQKEVTFGMRKLATQGTQFTMNGRPLMLRGTLECAIFPKTGYPPTDVQSWRRIYEIEKSYGLNFIRFHSWCPPDAAFTAADEEGIMIQAEGPRANVSVGTDPSADDFSETELMRIVQTYGNHPSFCLMSIGNEFGGANPILEHWVEMLIDADSRHLYSSASYGQPTTNIQWVETSKGRGIHGPGTESDATAIVARWKVPHIGHEIGQWTFYPNFAEIGKYTGVLKAKNFELVRDSLKAKGIGDEGHAFFEATGHEAVLLYKEEIENLLRTPGFAGFSLLDLHDYPGQGTALIGLLDPFWESKGFITPEQHKLYCGRTVPLLRFPKRTYATTESFVAKAESTNFGPADLHGVQPEWTIRGPEGKTIASGTLPALDLPTGKLSELGDITAPLDKVERATKCTVTLSLKDTGYSNSWEIWVYPTPANINPPANVMVSHAWDDAARAALAKGGRVVLFPALDPTLGLKGSFKPVFWSPVWFHREPATMGILCDPKNRLFSQFPTDAYTNWQWWNLIEGSRTMVLDDTPAGFRPLVQVIDNFARNDKLGNLFEAKVGTGSLLVCTLNLTDQTQPETKAFLSSLYTYASDFKPAQTLDVATLNKILSPTAPGGSPTPTN